MITEKRLPWFHYALRIRGGPLPHIWKRLLVSLVFSTVVAIAYETLGWSFFTVSPMPFTLIGVALSIFLGFRNNTAYERYWEARIFWGELLGVTRSLAIQIQTLIPVCPKKLSEEEQNEVCGIQSKIIHYMIAFSHALRINLRGEESKDILKKHLSCQDFDGIDVDVDIPSSILKKIGQEVQKAGSRGWVHPVHLTLIHESMERMSCIQTNCESIQNTPVPFTYRVLIHSICGLYCFLLPLGLIDTLNWMTPFVVCLIAYAFYGLDQIGEELEDPFGTDLNDLPIFSYTRTIERNLLQMLNEGPIPEQTHSEKEVLI